MNFDCLICLHPRVEQKQNLRSSFVKKRVISGLFKTFDIPSLPSSNEKRFEGSSYCSKCTRRFCKVEELFKQLDKIRREIDVIRGQITEEFNRSTQSFNEGYNPDKEDAFQARQIIIQRLLSSSNYSSLQGPSTSKGPPDPVKLENIQPDPLGHDFEDSFQDSFTPLDICAQDLHEESPKINKGTNKIIEEPAIILERVPVPIMKEEPQILLQDPEIQNFIKREEGFLNDKRKEHWGKSSKYSYLVKKSSKAGPRSVKQIKAYQKSVKRREKRWKETGQNMDDFIYKCDQEGCTFKSQSTRGLRGHLCRVHGIKISPFDVNKCSVCNKGFKDRTSLDDHVNVHTRIANILCDLCGKAFISKKALSYHMRSHGIGKQFPCPICQKIFTSAAGLKAHERVHTGEKSFQCHCCSKAFSRKQILEEHVESKHSNPNQSFCSKCGKCLNSSEELEAHLEKHRLFEVQCAQCDKIFINKTTYALHQKMHSGKFDHECSFCKKRFLTKGILQIHIRSHTGERSFKCPYCEAAFYQKQKLQRHFNTHKKDQFTICDICGDKFIFQEKFDAHMKLHLDPSNVS